MSAAVVITLLILGAAYTLAGRRARYRAYYLVAGVFVLNAALGAIA